MLIDATCVICRTTHMLVVNMTDYQSWRDGALIQNAMPYLTAGERELLISQTCESCFKQIFDKAYAE